MNSVRAIFATQCKNYSNKLSLATTPLLTPFKIKPNYNCLDRKLKKFKNLVYLNSLNTHLKPQLETEIKKVAKEIEKLGFSVKKTDKSYQILEQQTLRREIPLKQEEPNPYIYRSNRVNNQIDALTYLINATSRDLRIPLKQEKKRLCDLQAEVIHQEKKSTTPKNVNLLWFNTIEIATHYPWFDAIHEYCRF
ncbi:hypothetical protein BN1013_01625 [Candidatus Rubidus massiliensis]|nr:hypothetical protein BN1013_01625 [Candidatus Rubidus massiliensis]